MEADDSQQAWVDRPVHATYGKDHVGSLEVRLEAATLARADAERRAAGLSEQLADIHAGMGWRALTAYRSMARKVAPGGSRRGHAYDLIVGTVRRSAGRVRAGTAVRAKDHAVVPPTGQPAADASAALGPTTVEGVEVVGPPGANTWFRDHYEEAAARVVEFLAMDGITLEGKQVADIGAGDGILDLGLAHKGRPQRLVAFDLNAMSLDDLLAAAIDEGVCDALPPSLEFVVSGTTSIPVEDRSFDIVVSWSAFEHIADPLGVLREVRRVLRDDGCLFLQVWPFYHSQFGSHLRDWFPQGWEHLEHPADEIEAIVRSSDLHAAEWADVMLREFGELNKVTVDDLGGALLEAGFDVRRLNLLTRAVAVPPSAASRHALSVLGIEGVELLAVPLPR